MEWIGSVLNGLVVIMAVIHVYVFYLEAIAWGKPSVNRVFGLTDAQAQTLRPMAFNQGFYNLFIAIALLLGYFWASRPDSVAQAMILRDYGAASILGAGVVLWLSNPKLIRASVLQAGPAALYWILRLL